jgi:hypothetical protein
MNLTNLVLSQWLYERYVVGGIIGTAAFSLILLAGRITDSVSDPFIAFWTDNAWTRRGRRMPFLVLATLPLSAVSKDNKAYAVDAARLLLKGTRKWSVSELWRAVTDDPEKAHNSQMDVVLALWKNGLIVSKA